MAPVTIGVAMALSACTDPASLALGGASIVSFAHTGKTLTDHAMSAATDQNCSLKHSIAGSRWCQPRPNDADDRVEEAAAFCYHSIAATTCYRHENPHDTASRLAPPLASPGK